MAYRNAHSKTLLQHSKLKIVILLSRFFTIEKTSNNYYMQWDWKNQRSYSYYFNLTLQNIFSRLEVFAVLRSVSADKFSIYSQLSN
jgi:hypothetical protein